MKKIYLLLSALAIFVSADAQTVTNGGYETWRVSSAGSTNPKVVRAPINWYGTDSLIISMGQTFGTLLGISDTVWQQQLFKDSGANAHGGIYSAKLVTKDQDTLGIFPATLSNADAHVSFSLATGLGPITFTGGQATTLRTTSVSAWVKYVPTNNLDSATVLVQAYGNVAGNADSLIGIGTLKIGNTPSFTQITANVLYANPGLIVDTVRITFASSSTDTAFVNSTLWVDDVTAVGVAQVSAVGSITNGKKVNVYPNPASDVLYLTGGQTELVCTLMSVNGQVVATQSFTGNGSIDLAPLPSGLYFYNISDNGNIIQRGKVSVSK